MLTQLARSRLHMLNLHHSHVNRITPAHQFVIDDVFHQMRLFQLAESQPRVPKSDVLGIVLRRIIQITLAANIIAIRLAEEIGVRLCTEPAGILKFLKLVQIQGNRNDMIVAHTLLLEIPAKNRIQQVAFAAPANARDNFHRPISHGRHQSVKLLLANNHIFLFLVFPTKLNTIVVQQKPKIASSTATC